MTAIASHPSTATTTATARATGIWKTVVLATLAAAAATEAVVALANALGPDVTLQGEAMPTGGCAVGVLMCMVPAVALLAALRRWAPQPARTWVRATIVLTALSVIPDLAVSSTPASSRITLITAHLVAAAIIVPAAARKLR